MESEPEAVLFSCVSTVEACSWIEAAVEVPPHGAKEHKEGRRKRKRKDRAEEGLSGGFKERAPEREGCTKTAQVEQRVVGLVGKPQLQMVTLLCGRRRGAFGIKKVGQSKVMTCH